LKSGKYHFRIMRASVLLEELVRHAKIALILGRQHQGQKSHDCNTGAETGI
jgi:hypothetical protein